MEKQKTDFCMGCMSPLNRHGKCINCDFSLDSYKATPRCLPSGTLLNDRYLVGRVIGEGSFGVTYIGRDLLLGIIIAIKEYFPLSYGSRDVRKEEQTIYVYQDNDKKGLEHFYKEAKLLSQFHMLDGIVSVRDFFYANKTAYIVMDYIKGITLKEYVKKNGPVEGKEALAMMKPVIRSLHTIHQAEIIHRDISPDNLLLTEQKKLVLVDFGSARVEDSAMTQSMTVMFKRGYTPEEQYLRRGKLGAWSDVYSLCATMYFMLTGIVPNEAIERMLLDTMVPLTKMSSVSLTQKQKNAIMQGVCVNPKERMQSMLELYDALYDKEEEGFHKKMIFNGRQWKIAIFSILILMLCSSAGWQLKRIVMKQKQKAMNVAALTTEYPSALPAVATPEQIQMQSFAGLTKEQAENRFIALGDEQLSITWKKEYNDTVPKGTVITQNIPENTSYRSGSFKELVLTVSKGVKKAKVPSVTGISYQSAVKKLTSSNLSYRLDWKNSKKAKNMVLKQGKKAGEKVKEGTKIKLTVSKGPVKKPETNTPPATIQPTQPPAARVTPKPAKPAPTKKADDDFVGTIP